MNSSSCPSLLPSSSNSRDSTAEHSMTLLQPHSSASTPESQIHRCVGDSYCAYQINLRNRHTSKRIYSDLGEGSEYAYEISRGQCILITLVVVSFVIITALVAFLVGHTSAIPQQNHQHVDLLSISEPGSLLDLWAQLEEEKKTKSGGIVGVDGNELGRLPDHLIPQHYNILLNLSLTPVTYTVTGQVSVNLLCRNTSRTVVFNAAQNVEVLDARLKEELSGRPVKWISLQRQKSSEIFLLRLGEQLKESLTYILSLKFQSLICHSDSGVHCHRKRGYRRWKRDVNWSELNATADEEAQTGLSLMTKFEPALARSLLPCWDEPQFKAVFNVTVVHQAQMEVLSNTAALRRVSNEENEFVTSTFYETPPMSTYLLALASGPLVSSQTHSQHGVAVSVWTLPEDSYRTKFALEYSSHMFDVIEQYLVVPYPLSKLDLVASRNFPVGGMENWGLIVFHYQMLLDEESEIVELGSGQEDEYYLPDNRPFETQNNILHRFRTSKLIIHELLHQWFGNIVTMKWWDDLWLNEGFATFYTQHFLAKSYPLLVEVEHWLTVSRLWRSSDPKAFQPLALETTTEDSLKDAFHWTTYAKSCILVKMLYNLLGERTLRGGVIEYLRANAYKSVGRQDLWDKLGKVVHFGSGHVQIGPVMETWLTNPGFPEVQIIRNYREGSVTVTQKNTLRMMDSLQHEYYVPDRYLNDTKQPLWFIPFAYVSTNKPRYARPFWFSNKSLQFTDLDLPMGRWILANPNFQFPYRINYDKRNWRMLINQLIRSYTQISSKSRVQLMLDSSHFLMSSDEPQLHIKLLTYLCKETELLPVLIGVQEVWHVLHTFSSTPIYELLCVHFRNVVNNIVIRRNESVHILADAKEEKAVWKMAQTAADNLDQLMCAINHPECDMPRKSMHIILANPVNGQLRANPITACKFLQTKTNDREITQLLSVLDKGSIGSDPLLMQLAACSRDSKVIDTLVDIILRRRGVIPGFILNILSNPLSLNYNLNFRLALWNGMLNLSRNDKRTLLSRKSTAQVLLRSVGGLEEFKLASKLIPGFANIKANLEERFNWLHNTATPKIHSWLLRNLKMIQ